MDQFDYIVVGAGSAGCVLTDRLSANPAHKVLLVEAVGRDPSPWLRVPVGYFKTTHNPGFDWCYLTEPDPGIAGRPLQWPRGKVLGGSSALNGLLYSRGQPEDYNRWAEPGNPGWSFGDVLPYFNKSEDNDRGADEFHGVGGVQKVSDLRVPEPTVKTSMNSGCMPRVSICSGVPRGWKIFSIRSRSSQSTRRRSNPS